MAELMDTMTVAAVAEWTELIPVLVFIAVGVLFWWLGRKTRAEVAAPTVRSQRGAAEPQP